MNNTKNTNSNNTNSDNSNNNNSVSSSSSSSSSSNTDSNKSKSNNDNINASNDSSRQPSPIKRLSSRLTIDTPTRHSSITTTTSSPRNSSNSGDIIVSASASSISGYLYKQTRDGRWQRRWFETNGTFLTYYKSRKMERLLAALSLPQVGTITKLSNDKDQEGKEGLFALELNTRVYYLRAKTDNEAEYWVSTLSRLRDEGLSSNDAVQAIRISSNTSPTNIRNGQHGLAIQDSMRNNRSDWEKTSKYKCLSRICCCCIC